MAYYGQCGSCAFYYGSKNPFFAGECDIRQIEVYPGRSADDCPYYRPENNDDDNDKNNYDEDDDW